MPNEGRSLREMWSPCVTRWLPNPPPICFPTREERFAIRGVAGQNLSTRHLLLFIYEMTSNLECATRENFTEGRKVNEGQENNADGAVE